MLYPPEAARTWTTHSCHDGSGRMDVHELFKARGRRKEGFQFVHDAVLAPGAGIGEHTHLDDEEIYYIVEGHGLMTIDGRPTAVKAGDVIITRHNHSHGLVNSDDGPMRILVVSTALPKRDEQRDA